MVEGKLEHHVEKTERIKDRDPDAIVVSKHPNSAEP